MAGKEVATKDAAGLPAEYAGFEDHAGAGLNELDSSDKSTPFLKIIEKNSPEMDDDAIDCKPGQLMNTATKEVFDSVRFVPACREHAFVEWVPVDNGGGFVGSYGITEPISQWAKSQRGKIKLKNGNDLVETFYLFGALLDEDDNPTPVVISFTSTRIKAYKDLTNKASAVMVPRANGNGKFQLPWFAHVWRIGTDKVTKDKQSWFVFTADWDSDDKSAAGARLPSDHEAVLLGANLVEQKAAGTLKMADEAVSGEQPDTGSTYTGNGGGYDGGGSSDAGDDEPPF